MFLGIKYNLCVYKLFLLIRFLLKVFYSHPLYSYTNTNPRQTDLKIIPKVFFQHSMNLFTDPIQFGALFSYTLVSLAPRLFPAFSCVPNHAWCRSINWPSSASSTICFSFLICHSMASFLSRFFFLPLKDIWEENTDPFRRDHPALPWAIQSDCTESCQFRLCRSKSMTSNLLVLRPCLSGFPLNGSYCLPVTDRGS